MTDRISTEAERRGVQAQGSAEGCEPTRTLSVLVADDTPAYQKIITQLLRQRGHDVTFLGNGRDALDQFLQAHYDVVVLDVQMPVINGFEVAKAIRQHEEGSPVHTPIIALTAHSSAGDRETCLAAGMDAYLAKPIDAPQFIELVEKAASRSLANPLSQGVASDRGWKEEMNDDGLIVDFEGAMERLGDDLELFREFIKVFDEDVPSLLESIRVATADRNSTDLERCAHSLRGLISNFGARQAVEAAGQLEEIGKAEQWDELESALEALEREVQRLTAALDKYRQ